MDAGRAGVGALHFEPVVAAAQVELQHLDVDIGHAAVEGSPANHPVRTHAQTVDACIGDDPTGRRDAVVVVQVEDVDLLVWEAPIKNQQQELIIQFGNNVNLGNIPADEVLALEALRQGVRGDTLKRAYLADIENP